MTGPPERNTADNHTTLRQSLSQFGALVESACCEHQPIETSRKHSGSNDAGK